MKTELTLKPLQNIRKHYLLTEVILPVKIKFVMTTVILIFILLFNVIFHTDR